MQLGSVSVTIITCVLLLTVGVLTAIKVFPSELAAGILGSLGTSLALILQRNAIHEGITQAVKKSMRPPSMADQERENHGGDR